MLVFIVHINNIYIALNIVVILVKVICILIAVAYFTIAERKVMAAIQRRQGPNIEGGPFGLVQPIADGLKLLTKELIIPSSANILLFLVSPLLVFVLSICSWSVIPFQITWLLTDPLVFFESINFFSQLKSIAVSNNNYGILLLLAISSLNVYGIIFGGWASNSKYAFLGALRSASQMISYEVAIGLTILPVIVLSSSFNLTDIIQIQSTTTWFLFPLLPNFIIFFVSMLAETNRAPFDLPEAEAELVAGYNVEYSSMVFALYFLGEYSSMLVMATLLVILFLGGWTIPVFTNKYLNYSCFLIFAVKIVFFCFCYIAVRAAFPRYRYDQLMDIGWKIFLPFTLAMLVFTGSLSLALNISLIAI